MTTTEESAAPRAPFQRAPRGFSPHLRAQFDRNGLVIVPDALEAEAVSRYLEAVDRVVGGHDIEHHPFFSRENVVELDTAFEDLIDHPRHVGFVYDLFGEQLMLHSSQVFIRGGPSGPGNQWHPDGPRALPYGVFTSRPVQVKIAYWPTDVPVAGMANLVVRPGSQNDQYFEGYDTWDEAGDELVLCPASGRHAHHARWRLASRRRERHQRRPQEHLHHLLPVMDRGG